MQGVYPRPDSSLASPSGFESATQRGSVPYHLGLATGKTEKAHHHHHPTLPLQTFNSASLLACAGLALFCVAADHALQLSAVQRRLWLRAALDNATHGLVGLWSWAVVIGIPARERRKRALCEVLLTGLLASLVDVDHFYMAGSLSLEAAVSLARRPPLHCSSLIPVLCLSLHLLGRIAQTHLGNCASCSWLSSSLPWMLFVAMATHHVRDGARHGLALCPLGSTPPVPYWAYVGVTAALPLLCSALGAGTRDSSSGTKRGAAAEV